MKKIVLIITVMFLTCNGFAKDLRTLFADMPDSIIPLLTKSNRMDCVDYMESGMKAVVTNRLGGTTEMLSLDKDYLIKKVISLTIIFLPTSWMPPPPIFRTGPIFIREYARPIPS